MAAAAIPSAAPRRAPATSSPATARTAWRSSARAPAAMPCAATSSASTPPATGGAALPNPYGIVLRSGAQANTIGGTAAGTGNVISGNSTTGLWVGDAGTSRNLVQGNRIGTDATGQSGLGAQYGVALRFGASN